jgi:hypothetical protein
VLHDTKYYWRRITKPIPSIVAVVQRVTRYQVLLAAYHKADTKYYWRRITKPIPSIVGGVSQSRYQVLLAAYHKADTSIVAVVQRVTRYQVLLAAYHKAF